MKIVNSRRGVLSEAVEGSMRWRQIVAYAVAVGAIGREDLPFAGPVRVDLDFYLPVDPLGARAGDVDKLARNVLDALSACGSAGSSACEQGCRKHAGVYRDDSQVVALSVSKYGPRVEGQGVRIRVRAISG